MLPDPAPDRVRVVVVDDVEDLRFLLRVQLSRDPRFEVVAEAADGEQAIAAAAEHRPDLMILDRAMPNLGGLEAMPEIRRVSPQTAIILYTANADPMTSQVAADAGAISVLEKATPGGRFVEQLVESLVERATQAETTQVVVGPVASSAARVWVPNARAILDAVVANPDVLDVEIAPEMVELFCGLLDQWDSLANSTDEFRWVAQARPDDVRRIVESWAAIDAMSTAQLERLGVEWSPPEGQPFFQALTTGVLEALQRHEEMQRLASRLVTQWAPYRTE